MMRTSCDERVSFTCLVTFEDFVARQFPSNAFCKFHVCHFGRIPRFSVLFPKQEVDCRRSVGCFVQPGCVLFMN